MKRFEYMSKSEVQSLILLEFLGIAIKQLIKSKQSFIGTILRNSSEKANILYKLKFSSDESVSYQ